MDLMDTDVVVDLLRGKQEALQWLSQQQKAPALCRLVKRKLIQGTSNKAERERLLKALAPFQLVYPSGMACALALAELERLRLSTNLGIIDALIAATAVRRKATLFTFNQKHFRDIKNLSSVAPYNRL